MGKPIIFLPRSTSISANASRSYSRRVNQKGGKWSFDPDNRNRLDKGVDIPKEHTYRCEEAERYVEKHFSKNPGELGPLLAPYTRADAKRALKDFLTKRFSLFGVYQDAIEQEETVLFHSLLSAPLNVGLLLPGEVIEAALDYAKEHRIAISALEGFIRQILGWREFVRGVYLFSGKKQAKSNFWGHRKKLPYAFWTGQTGLLPVDCAIQRVVKEAYTHHIERLMVLGSIFLLLEIHPREVYRWFMELFIDAYDWVMVPNVFGMSQWADGGLMTTKPYFCSSNYVLKMSHYARGPWCPIWDALYWHFVSNQRKVLSKNARLFFSVKGLERLSASKKKEIEKVARGFIKSISS